jgi:hypothetical protein
MRPLLWLFWFFFSAWRMGIEFFWVSRGIPALLFVVLTLGLGWWCISDSENLFSAWKISAFCGLVGALPFFFGLALSDFGIHD